MYRNYMLMTLTDSTDDVTFFATGYLNRLRAENTDRNTPRGMRKQAGGWREHEGTILNVCLTFWNQPASSLTRISKLWPFINLEPIGMDYLFSVLLKTSQEETDY